MLLFRTLYEDTHLIVLSKPAGLLSQGEITGDRNLVDELRAYFGRNYVGLVHRLDRNTSGVMVVAKRTKAAQRLTESLQTGKMERSYLGWVVGQLTEPVKWTHELEKNPKTNTVRAIRRARPNSKTAVLTATPTGHGHLGGVVLTLVQFKLETGRSHQIRAQASAEGFPLLGDVKYSRSSRGAQPTFSRTALHSHDLKFPHPMSGEGLHFVDPLPADLAALI